MSAFQFLLFEVNSIDGEVVQATLTAGGIDHCLVRVNTRTHFVKALEIDQFDLILADYHLPDSDGKSTLDLARQLRPEIPLIFVSASVGEELAIDALEAGAAGFVLKHRLERLVPCVQRVLQQVQVHREQRQRDAHLREQEQDFRAIFNIKSVGKAQTDAMTRRFLRVDPKLCEMTGYSESELLALTVDDQDVSDRKRVEQEREQLLQREQAARETAEAANRLKDEFLAVLSHELRSPLTSILGWTTLLRNGKLSPNRQVEALRTIENSARLQAQLVENLLDISQIIQGKLSFKTASVSLSAVISDAVDTVRLTADAKNIQILLNLETTIAPIFGDAGRLQQVLWNLLNNAIKFTPNGGQVTVELKQIDDFAQIQVIDTGKGIKPQFLPHMFEYFRQEDSSITRQFGGLGLGLAIARQIIEMHGGTIQAESLGENQGAVLTLQLPVIQQSVATKRQ